MKKSSMLVIVIPLVALFIIVSAVVLVKTFTPTKPQAGVEKPLPALGGGAGGKVTNGFGAAAAKSASEAVSSIDKELQKTATDVGTSDLDALDKQAAGL